uniref:Uncharacterized protein n=1 Tax=Ditylenchus dipsaci TaxID=166011 RepID=A0A915CQI0_9BILA
MVRWSALQQPPAHTCCPVHVESQKLPISVNPSLQSPETNNAIELKQENGSKLESSHELGSSVVLQTRMVTSASVCLKEEDITTFQHQKIKELRERLGDQLLERTPIFNDNFSLLRWLIGWNYKIEEIIPRFEKTSSALRCLNVSNLIIEDVDELNAFVKKDHSLQVLGRSMPKTLAKCGRVSDVYRLTIIETALIYQLVR